MDSIAPFATKSIATMKSTPRSRGEKVRGSRTGKPIMALLDLLGAKVGAAGLWELREGPLSRAPFARRAAG